MDSTARAVESNLYSCECGLYIHIAFCRKKCIYCDFYSVGDRKADWHGYVDSLIAELNHKRGQLPHKLRTIYIGGGTPSLVPPDEFKRLSVALRPYLSDVEEFTLEVNPDDVSQDLIALWKEAGVNRLSMGIQSFDDRMLAAINRRHSAAGALDAYGMCREAFDNISIDLIYGLPGQTMEMWRRDVEKAISLRPSHISAYSLMYEPGTALTLLRDRGAVEEVEEAAEEEMMRFLVDSLRNAGYEHYEISNFALPGCRSIHNSSYWHQVPYLGLGPSAHSYDGRRVRSANVADIKGYIRYWKGEDHAVAVSTEECLSDTELREEYVMTRLRTREGIDMADFRKRFGLKEYNRLLENSRMYLAEGNLILSDGFMSLSEEAIFISDTVILDLA